MADHSALETWVREELGLDPEAEVTITEKPGTDPRCSDVITVVAVSGSDGDAYEFHVERGLAEMERMDLVAALAFGGSH